MQVRPGPTLLAWGLLWMMTSPAAAPGESAIEQFQGIQKALHESHTRKDWQANLAASVKQRDLLNGSPDSQLEVARAEFFLGRNEAGLADLTRYARMGQSVDPSPLAPNWAGLAHRDGVVQLQHTMAGNRSAIATASVAFELPDHALLPEDIDYDVHTRLFYISSVREKKIITANERGEVHDFATAPDGWPVVALKLDTGHERLWVTEVALQGYEFAPAQDWGRSVLLAFDLKSRAIVERIEGPKASSLGDMLVMPGGDVIVSDGDGGGVYRLPLHGTTLQRVDHGDFISPQTPALASDDAHLFVPDYVRGIAVLDLRSGQTQWIPMADRFALNGIDGLYFDHGRLIATQNGTSIDRVVAFRMEPSLRKIASEGIIERATPTLGDPTHGVVVGESFYYIANAGWDAIDEHGKLKSAAQLPQSRIMRADLSRL